MRYIILTLTVALCLALVSSNPLPDTKLQSADVNPESENHVNAAEAESQNNEVRVQFADETPQEELDNLRELDKANGEEISNEDRDKRQGGSSPPGSGNWIFDIIRLAAGSSGGSSGSWGSSEEKPIVGPTQGMTMAIPGPFTRLLLIANRGAADLIEDIVLRLAATSERFVNYKAKLINWWI
ncbi:uncharacterized protein [Anoplolepis gracilipes]|uniref:uncharacterized protein isoform X2 n=1 Tax=Anoplolepis gracilipes TaxID=354296 RepID=UPI003B9DFAD8